MAEQKEHLVSPVIYVVVLIILITLMCFTVIMAFVDVEPWTTARHLGSGWNTGIAIASATAKAILIGLFFMHIRYGSRLTWVFASAGFVWLMIMLALTMTDYMTRNHPAGVSPRGEPKYILPVKEPPGRPPQIDQFPGDAGRYH